MDTSRCSRDCSFFSYNSRPTQGKVESTANTYQSLRTCSAKKSNSIRGENSDVFYKYKHKVLHRKQITQQNNLKTYSRLPVYFTCGTPSSLAASTMLSSSCNNEPAEIT
jgi:hypothetical protein